MPQRESQDNDEPRVADEDAAGQVASPEVPAQVGARSEGELVVEVAAVQLVHVQERLEEFNKNGLVDMKQHTIANPTKSILYQAYRLFLVLSSNICRYLHLQNPLHKGEKRECFLKNSYSLIFELWLLRF